MSLTTTAEPKAVKRVFQQRELEDMRCRSCRKLLFRSTANPVRPDAMIHVRCYACNAENYMVGVQATT